MINQPATVSIEFCETLGFEKIDSLGVYKISEIFQAINQRYPQWKNKVMRLFKQGYSFQILVNGEFICRDMADLNLLLPYEKNEITISALPMVAGKDFLNVGLGVGLVVAGLSGVALLGFSATSVGLFGASLVFSSLFKHPNTDANRQDDENEDQKSVNFSGTINTTGGGQTLPLVFGKDVVIGSIVASAQIVPHDAEV
ncbi:MAG: hypothetical protein AAF316_00355 [Cyanobacteria bacterium P01_A01_bin.80]